MAGEYSNFDSSVQLPIIKKHCATFTSEVSLKMEHTQPFRNMWNFSYADQLAAKCEQHGIAMHGHCGIWHLQNPPWLEPALQVANEEQRYYILTAHVINLLKHFGGVCQSMDVVNEFEPGMALIWGAYLGYEAGSWALEVVKLYKGDCKIYYNSFFKTDSDADYAISVLPHTDGIGVQLHLNTWSDYTALFARVRRMAEACKAVGKRVRFSEISVVQGDAATFANVCDVYRQIVRLALEYPLTITDFVTWGVKGQSWNGGYLLFDTAGKENAAFWAVVDELKSRHYEAAAW